RRRQCRARASLPVCGVTRETDDPGETSKWSLRPSFMNRLCPAETRLKEGAHAHDSDQTGGSVPLPRVGGALSARFRQYQGTAASMSNAAVIDVLPKHDCHAVDIAYAKFSNSIRLIGRL